MKKPYPKSERCPTCKRIIGGSTTNSGSWYCDYCKVSFGVIINKTTSTTGYLKLGEKWYSK